LIIVIENRSQPWLTQLTYTKRLRTMKNSPSKFPKKHTTFTFPAHLVQNRYGFCFRIIVPVDLRQLVGKVEIRQSLRTRNVTEAVQKSILLGILARQHFKEIRETGMKKDIDRDQANETFNKLFKDLFQKKEEAKLKAKQRREQPVVIHTQNLIVQTSQEPVIVSDSGQTDLHNSDAFGTQKSSKTEAAKDISEGMSEGMTKGNIGGLTKGTPKIITLKNLVSKYETWKIAEGDWTEQSKGDIVPYLNWFKDFMGEHVPIDEISTTDVEDFKICLRNLPPNWKKMLKFKKLSIRQIAELKHDRTLSDQTIINTMDKLGAMFEYAVGTKKGITFNPFNKYTKGKRQKKENTGDMFTHDELTMIFHAIEYVYDKFDHPFMFWLPIIALYTGARLNELCQLHTDDIREHDNILCISINEEHEKHTKNETSIRDVPMHPFLLRLGFHIYAEHQRQAGHMLIFNELKRGKKGYIHKPSHDFNAFLDSLGIISRSKVFHSFRYTVINELHKAGLNTLQIADVVGHDKDSPDEPVAKMTLKYLERTMSPEDITKRYADVQRHVGMLKYPGLNLNHLLNSRYAVVH